MCDEPQLPVGVVIANANASYAVGFALELNCVEDFEGGSVEGTLTCQEGGVWNGTMPQCSETGADEGTRITIIHLLVLNILKIH